MAVTKPAWTPSSWRTFPALHQPEWPSEERAEAARARLAIVPPLVFAGEARQLKASLALAAEGRAFLLQAGECAESFNDLSAVHIREKLKIMLQMAAVLTYGATLPVVKVGRFAGQLAKARTSPTEEVERGRDPVLPRTHDPRRRAHAGGADPRPRPDGAGLPPRDRDAQPPARLHEGRFRRPHARARVEPGVRRLLARGPPLRAVRLRDRARAALHGRVRHRPLGGVAAAPGGRLDEPRGPRARLRGGAHPPRLDDGRLVRLLRAHALDRGADAPARRGARRVLLRRSESARAQGRADGDARRDPRALRAPQPARASPGA